jgi:hypothetical protein
MLRNNDLRDIMQEELPSIGYQKRLGYRTNYDEVVYLYRLINKTIFNNELEMPEIEVFPRCRKYWGMCFGSYERIRGRKSYCKIRLMDKWYCKQWLVSTLAHEMCHQYQWDIIGEEREANGKDRLMSHGASFFRFKEKLAKHGISLKRAHGRRRWFKHQDFWKC